MIEVKDLVKAYDGHVALKNVSFHVGENEIFGFLGPNGAGKSTTMNIITGYLAPTSGTVEIDGHNILEEPIQAKKRMGYLPEQPPLYLELTPQEYLRFVAEAKGIRKGERQAEVERVMEKVNLMDVRHQLIKTLSKGYRQRVGIAQALLGKPKVIILDEPTVGLDPLQMIEVREMIKEIGREHTVILSSHILAEIQEICTKIMIMVKGRLVAIDTPENLAKRLQGEGALSLENIFVTLVQKEEDASC